MSESDDEIPADDEHASGETSAPDMTEASDRQSPARAMTFKELKEAVEDESHPRHEEAVQYSKELSEQFRPALDSLRQTVGKSFDVSSMLKGLKVPTAKQLAISSFDKALSESVDLGLPKLNYVEPEISRFKSPDYEPIGMPDDKGFLDDIAEASHVNNERAERQVEVLEGLWATMIQIQSENKKSSRLNTLLVTLTLIATLAGIITSIVLALVT